ncbi:MAG: PaaI family thioesterase [Bacillota bacterium]|nr:PaaI family thioesterase [Bacillota bacterium]
MTKEELLQRANERCPYNKYNGITVTDIGEDNCVVEGELRPEAMNPWGMAHGGFVYSLCDVAAGVVVSRLNRRGVTLSGNMYYLRPSVGKSLRAEGRIIKDGKTVVLVETNVYNDEGVHTARGEFQIYIIDEE